MITWWSTLEMPYLYSKNLTWLYDRTNKDKKQSLEARGLRSLALKNQMPNTILIDALLCWRGTFWLWCRQGMDLNSGQRNSLLIYTARGGNHWQFHDSRGIRQLIDASKQASKHARCRRDGAAAAVHTCGAWSCRRHMREGCSHRARRLSLDDVAASLKSAHGRPDPLFEMTTTATPLWVVT